MKKRRNFAVLLFVLALIFCAAEVFALSVAKTNNDRRLAKENAEELSVELGLISSALGSGNKTLYDDALSRYRGTLANFSSNEYVYHYQADLLTNLRNYNELLNTDAEEIKEFIELSTALATVRTSLRSGHTDKLDASIFSHLEQSLTNLTAALDNTKAENLASAKEKLSTVAKDMGELVKNSAVCLSVCTKEVFEGKQRELEDIKNRYAEDFKTLGTEASKKYDPSELIVQLGRLR